jgi:hypothetical protein
MKQGVQGGKTMEEQFYADRTYLRDLLKRHPEWTTCEHLLDMSRMIKKEQLKYPIQ